MKVEWDVAEFTRWRSYYTYNGAFTIRCTNSDLCRLLDPSSRESARGVEAEPATGRLEPDSPGNCAEVEAKTDDACSEPVEDRTLCWLASATLGTRSTCLCSLWPKLQRIHFSTPRSPTGGSFLFHSVSNIISIKFFWKIPMYFNTCVFYFLGWSLAFKIRNE